MKIKACGQMKRLLVNLGIVDFQNYFGCFSILFAAVVPNFLYYLYKKKSKSSQNNSENRLSPNPLTFSKLFIVCLILFPFSMLAENDRRLGIYQYFPKGGIGCEVGVDHGHFSQQLLDYVTPVKLYLIDPWKVFRKETPHNAESYIKEQQYWDNMYQSVCMRFINRPEVTIIRDRGEAAADLFGNEFFDWIYIDGDHSYEGAFVDFFKYFSRLKRGGVMIADDYPCEGVRQAFIDFRKICKDISSTKTEGSQLIIFKK